MGQLHKRKLWMNVRYETGVDVGEFSVHVDADSLEKLLRRAIRHRLFTKRELLKAAKRITK